MKKQFYFIIFILSFGFGVESNLIDSLTLREKIAQMIMVRVRGDFYNSKSWYKGQLKKWINEDGIGGVITFGGSVHGTYYNNKMFQSWVKNVPLLISADYERGTGQWLSGGTLFPSNMAITASSNSLNAYKAGRITATEATALGIHIILGPVMDINNNPANPIINFRSYSDDVNSVSKFGTQFIKGVQDGGRIACAKHYPGHGNTATDSHSSLPTIQGSRDELEKVELSPFKTAVDSGVGAIMTAHISVPGLDSNKNPASHSWRITTGILKNEWGFAGLVITDGMEMGGLTQSAWAGESAILAIEAGADILLLPVDVEKTINSIEKAVKKGRLSIHQINKSVSKILKAKSEFGLFKTVTPEWTQVKDSVGLPKNKSLSQKIANESITLVKDNQNLIPLKPEKIKELTHLIISTDDGIKSKLNIFIKDINRTHGNVNEILVSQKLKPSQIEDIISEIKNKPKPILVSALVRIRMDKGEATIDSTHNLLLKRLYEEKVQYVLSSFGSPYLPEYNHIPTYLCAFGYGSISLKAMANAIWGRIPIEGVLPVNLNDIHKKGDGIKRSKRKYGFEKNIKLDFNNAFAIIDSFINKKIFPGAQIFVSKKGKILASQGFGSHTYENKSPPVTEHSIYDIASITKILSTTPIIMKLVSQKKINLDHPVKQYIPEFNGPFKNKVTLRHLLTHSAGLEPYIEYFLEDKIKSKNEIINDIINRELLFEPGSQMKYSDLGMILLAEVISIVQNKSFKSLAEKYIFTPFNMENTSFNPSKELLHQIVPTEIDNRFRKRLVHGEVHDENAFILGGVAPHAGIFSTAKDIGNYFQMLLNGGTWLGKRYFNSSIINQFTKRQNIPINSDRAIGFDTPSRNGKSSAGDFFGDLSFGHLGFTGTSVWADPENDIIIVLLTNRVHPTREKKGIYQARRMIYNSLMKQLLLN
jgi:beta-N-acetylhexosaminidase